MLFFCYFFVIFLLFFCYFSVIFLLFFCYFFVIFLLFFCYFFAFSMSFFCYLPLLVSSLASDWGRAQKPSSTDLDLEDAQHGEKFSKRAAQ